jgi:uncharacterized protein YfbU (UPF0304 family)
MAQLNVRLDDQTRDSFDALARARGLSASDLIRSLIDSALGRTNGDRPTADAVPQSLSATERRALALQHEILARLTSEPDEDNGGWESEHHRHMIEVLSSGYTAEYPDMFQMIQPELTRRECSLVNDILDMFSTLEASMGRLTEEERASLGEHAEHGLTFRGFDFNNSQEARLASYARYLIKTERWESMAEHFDAQHESGNSHSPTLASYERMLSVWRPIWNRKIATHGGPSDYLFAPDELREILAAWPYPKEMASSTRW